MEDKESKKIANKKVEPENKDQILDDGEFEDVAGGGVFDDMFKQDNKRKLPSTPMF